MLIVTLELAIGESEIEEKFVRTQEQNRQDARRRLAALLHKATEVPKPRRPTRPTRVAQVRRLEGKRRRGQLKRLRRVQSE